MAQGRIFGVKMWGLKIIQFTHQQTRYNSTSLKGVLVHEQK